MGTQPRKRPRKCLHARQPVTQPIRFAPLRQPLLARVHALGGIDQRNIFRVREHERQLLETPGHLIGELGDRGRWVGLVRGAQRHDVDRFADHRNRMSAKERFASIRKTDRCDL